MGADCRVLGDLFVAFGTIEAVLCLFILILLALVQLGPAMGTDRRIGGNLFVALGAIEAILRPALGAGGLVRVHLRSALGAEYVLIQVQVIERFVVHSLLHHVLFLVIIGPVKVVWHLNSCHCFTRRRLRLSSVRGSRLRRLA